MKTKILSLILLAVCVGLTGCSHNFKPNFQKDRAKYIEVQKLLKAITDAVNEARSVKPSGPEYTNPQTNEPDNLLNYLDEVEIELSNSFSYKLSNDLEFWVIKSGYSRETAKSTSFKYTFKPAQKLSENKNAVEKKRYEDLLKALQQLGPCLKAYKNNDYTLNKVVLEVGFEIKNDADAGVEFKLYVFKLNPKGEFAWDRGNTITLTFDLSKAKS